MDIEQAMQTIDRKDFLPEEYWAEARQDRPLPIGYGQTNSQPTTVRRMLEWLDPWPGDNVLDIGSGSGWTSALLGAIVGENGHVSAVEVIPELVQLGRENCDRAGCTNVRFFQAGRTVGLPVYGPYDRILVSAGAAKLPGELLSQLKSPGKLVIPIGETIHEIEKNEAGELTDTEYYGYVFVPLITDPS